MIMPVLDGTAPWAPGRPAPVAALVEDATAPVTIFVPELAGDLIGPATEQVYQPLFQAGARLGAPRR
jgi:hypothetical protein